MESFLKIFRDLGTEATGLTFWGAFGVFLLAAIFIFAMGWRSRLMMTKARRVILLVLRIAILLLLTGALSQITVTKYEKALSVAFLVDVSQSIPEMEISKTRAFIEKAWKAKGDISLRMLNFDSKAIEADKTNGSMPKIARLSTKPGTDIARALHTGHDLFVKDTFQRGVIFTDGNQTRGDILFETQGALARGIEVNVIPLETRTDRDIYIESINLPRKARPGEPIKISVTVVSNFAVKAKLIIKRGKATEIKREIDVSPGSNTYDFDTKVKSNFNQTYSASIDAAGDDHLDNNTLSSMLRVIGNPRIMVYSGEQGADLDLLDAFTANKLSVKAAPLANFPKSARGLTPFDLVVLSNIDFLRFGKSRAKTLEKFVGEYGGGLLVIGGEKGSELREKADKDKRKREKLPIEMVLPVWLKEKKKTEPNPVALILVIDKSSSMARENKFGMAIRAAKDSIEILSDRSKIGVVLFDDFPRWAIPIQSAQNRDAIIKELDRFGVDGGTSIYPALKEAYAKLKPMPNKVKHVILLSDGYSISMFNQNAHLLQYMADKKITISTVALGKESDQAHLRKIAQMGKGRFYYTEDISKIPKIFMKETKSISKTNVVETKFKPKLVKRGNMLAGINFKTFPNLYGYNSAKAKPTSEVYITAEKLEPMTARWRFGLGKVTFVGTDSGMVWAREMPEWSDFQKFWTNIARNTLGDRKRRSYRLKTRIEGERAIVEVDALDHNGNFINDLDLRLEVSPPDGEPVDVPLLQSRPGGYKGSFKVAGFGDYSFFVKAKDLKTPGGGGIGRVFLAPPTEFISQAPNTPLMKKIVKAGKGKYNPTIKEIFEIPEQTYPRVYPIWPYLLYTALGLFLLSVLIRRS